MAITAALRKIYAVAPDGQYHVYCISMNHSALPSEINITNNPVGFLGELSMTVTGFFESLPFSIKFPDKDSTGSQKLELQFSNLEQKLIDSIDLISQQPYEPVICRLRVYILGVINPVNNAHIQQMQPSWPFEISSFTINSTTITAVGSRTNMHTKPFPSELYNPTFYPGLNK